MESEFRISFLITLIIFIRTNDTLIVLDIIRMIFFLSSISPSLSVIKKANLKN